MDKLKIKTAVGKGKGKRKQWFALAVVVIVFFAASVSMFFMVDRDGKSEQKKCDDYCITEYGVKGLFVQIITNQRTRPGGYEGPWKCQCPR